MEFFLTGGTGFIGSHFLQNALSKNYKVNALRRGKNSNPKINLNKEKSRRTCKDFLPTLPS